MPAPERLDAEKLRAALEGITIGNTVIVLAEAISTNDVVLEMAQQGADEGLVVFAETQTAGRGQRGNLWESAPYAGLWLSVLLRPKIDITNPVRLTEWAASTLVATINDELSLGATIKPPNDVYINGRKVAGVLVELRAQPGGPHIAIVGLGLNVNHTAADFSPELRDRAASLAMFAGRTLDRDRIAVTLLRNLDRSYAAIGW